MPYIRMDISYECPASDLCKQMETHKLTMRVIQAEGPAGGNPYVEFSGEYVDLVDFLKLDVSTIHLIEEIITPVDLLIRH